jgi:hypothetical protein
VSPFQMDISLKKIRKIRRKALLTFVLVVIKLAEIEYLNISQNAPIKITIQLKQ